MGPQVTGLAQKRNKKKRIVSPAVYVCVLVAAWLYECGPYKIFLLGVLWRVVTVIGLQVANLLKELREKDKKLERQINNLHSQNQCLELTCID